MHIHLMSVALNLGSESVKAPLVPADERVVPLEGLLLLLPLNRVLLGPVIVHLGGVDAAPPDVQLVFTQLALQGPFLGVCTTLVNLQVCLGVGLVGAV